MAKESVFGLRAHREARLLTQEEVAELLGVTHVTVHRWELDGPPQDERIAKLERRWGVAQGGFSVKMPRVPYRALAKMVHEHGRAEVLMAISLVAD